MILIRHGQSEFNVHFSRTGIDPGIVDPHLTATGREQVRQAAEAIQRAGRPIARVLTSPYTRALQNAESSTMPESRSMSSRWCASMQVPVRRRHLPLGFEQNWPWLKFDHLEENLVAPWTRRGRCHAKRKSSAARRRMTDGARSRWAATGASAAPDRTTLQPEHCRATDGVTDMTTARAWSAANLSGPPQSRRSTAKGSSGSPDCPTARAGLRMRVLARGTRIDGTRRASARPTRGMLAAKTSAWRREARDHLQPAKCMECREVEGHDHVVSRDRVRIEARWTNPSTAAPANRE